MKGWKIMFQGKGGQKQTGVHIFISDNADFKLKLLRRDLLKGHYMLIKRTIHQEDITIIITYAPNIGGPNFIKQEKRDR
jgi:hypothetical protein